MFMQGVLYTDTYNYIYLCGIRWVYEDDRKIIVIRLTTLTLWYTVYVQHGNTKGKTFSKLNFLIIYSYSNFKEKL